MPVEPNTVGQWTQPPFSGLYDGMPGVLDIARSSDVTAGEWIWGRGSCDDKSGLIGIMIALESLISKGFNPTRTLILGFGFDEETGGKAVRSARSRMRNMLRQHCRAAGCAVYWRIPLRELRRELDEHDSRT